MKTILLPIRLSANTLSLLECAERMCSEMQAGLVFLYVVPKQSYDNGTFAPKTDVHQRVVQEARVILEQLSRKAIIHGIRSRIVVMDGTPGEAILQVARQTRASMVVLEKDGWVQGNVVEKIIHQSPCPVLTWSESSTQVASKPVCLPAIPAHRHALAAA